MRWLRRLLIGPRRYDRLQRCAEELIQRFGIEGTEVASSIRSEAANPSPFLSGFVRLGFQFESLSIIKGNEKAMELIRKNK